MDKQIIQKVVNLVGNLRSLGFNACQWSDIEAGTGSLGKDDKEALASALSTAGGVLVGKVWDFSRLNISTFIATPISGKPSTVKLVSVIAKVVGGTWGWDEVGKVRFVKDLNYRPPVNNDVENIDDEDDEDNFDWDAEDDEPEGQSGRSIGQRRGKLNLDL
jgi:hypothetical protein